MPRILYNVDNLVSDIRQQLDEQNVDSVSTELDILPCINRGQDYAFDILATRYPEPILRYAFMPLLGNVAEYDIPDFVFEDRIQKIEMQIPATGPQFPPNILQTPTGNVGSTFREVQRVSYRDISNYESASRTNVPYYYAIYGRKIRFVPTPTGIYGVRMWYLTDPEKLVLPQGRITGINTAGNYVIVDQAGSALSTESDQLGSYVNFVDHETGEIVGTMQIASINGGKITFRSVPQRTTIFNRAVTGDITTLTTAPTDPVLALDFYLAPVDGTCVPYFGRPLCNFLTQFAVAEITRKLGGQAETEEAILQKFEQQVSRVWTGREQQLRVKKRSQNWGVPTRRWYYE